MSKHKGKSGRARHLTLKLGVTGALFAAPIVVLAQTASTASGSGGVPPIDEVVVSGSRVVTDGTQAPTPVTVLSREDMELAAPATLSDALNQLPYFRNSSRPQNVSVSSTANSAGSFLNLRGLGQKRTLILLNGRRIVPSSGEGVPDASILPQKLVQRTDVVTGGASAAYGSDAVAGVVNFVLDTRFSGLRGDFQSGISSYGDAESVKASLTGGTDFADGRGHVVFSGEYYDSKSVDDPNGRRWAEAGWGLIPNAPGETPKRVLRSGVTNPHTTFGGVINSSPLAGTHFLPGGMPDVFEYGDLRSAVYMVGGDGDLDFVNISAGLERWSLFTHALYDLSDNIELTLEGSYADSSTSYRQRSTGNVAGNQLTIFSDNAFLPESLRQRMIDTGTESFQMGRTHRDFGELRADASNQTWRIAGGVNVNLGGGWGLAADVTYGENTQLLYTKGNLNYRSVYAGADAVRDEAGNIVCRSTLSGYDPGCVPINLFGEGSPSQEAINYSTGQAFLDMTLKQHVASVTVTGSPFDTWAGDVNVAIGAEYRKESSDQAVDEISLTTLTGEGLRGFPAGNEGNRGGWSHSNPQPIAGSYDIREIFAEAIIPLARDTRFAQGLELNSAFRLTDYSTSGAVNTWKLGVSYQPVDDVRLRATRSRDIRAANINELFLGSRQSSGVITEPGTGRSVNFIGSTQGNPVLDPEKADTLTFGVVYQPSWLPNFSVSLDAYDIEISGAIASYGSQETLDQCAAGSAVACGLITDNNGIYNIVLPFLNLEVLETNGIDLEASYGMDMFRGQVAFRALLNYSGLYDRVDASGVRDSLMGDIGSAGMPEWGGTFSVTYRDERLLAFMQQRYIGKGIYNRRLVEGIDIADNTIGSVFYTDMTLQYDVMRDEQVQVFLTVNNLFNRTPPIAPRQSSERFRASHFGVYDAIGRYFTAGIKFRL